MQGQQIQEDEEGTSVQNSLDIDRLYRHEQLDVEQLKQQIRNIKKRKEIVLSPRDSVPVTIERDDTRSISTAMENIEKRLERIEVEIRGKNNSRAIDNRIYSDNNKGKGVTVKGVMKISEKEAMRPKNIPPLVQNAVQSRVKDTVKNMNGTVKGTVLYTHNTVQDTHKTTHNTVQNIPSRVSSNKFTIKNRYSSRLEQRKANLSLHYPKEEAQRRVPQLQRTSKAISHHTSNPTSNPNPTPTSKHKFHTPCLQVIELRLSDIGSLETNIHSLWGLYQLLTGMMMGMRQSPDRQRNAIVKYVQDVCSNKFQFISQYLLKMSEGGTALSTNIALGCPPTSHLLTRIVRTVVSSRLLENISMVYLSISICRRAQIATDLVNYLGYCTSNLIFFMRLLGLAYVGGDYSSPTRDIFDTIRAFQMQSYRAQITTFRELILRMEHNNQIIIKIQHKMCSKMNRNFQQSIHNFLKYADKECHHYKQRRNGSTARGRGNDGRDSELQNDELQNDELQDGEYLSSYQRNSSNSHTPTSFCQFSRYIFEYLSYDLHASKQPLSVFPFVEMPPTPYFQLSKPYTIAIEPLNVLIATKNNSYYIRAYTSLFLEELSKYCNIVYYTQLMPMEADVLLEYLPKARTLYRYHCKYEDGKYVKMLWRIGGGDCMIIDSDREHFKYEANGVELPWKGMKQDTKLMEVGEMIKKCVENEGEFGGVVDEIRRKVERRKKGKWMEQPIYSAMMMQRERKGWDEEDDNQ